MQRALWSKALLVAGVFVVLLVALSMIHGIVAERAARQQAVAQEIAASNFGRQILAGPILSLPYSEEYDETIGEGRDKRIERRRIERTLRVFPATAEMNGTAAVGEKRRGLFKVRIFNAEVSVRGEFVLDGKIKVERARTDSRLVWGQAVVSLAISDPRGLTGAPAFDWNGQRIAFARGSLLPGMASGLHAAIPPLEPATPQRVSYALAIGLQGTESAAIVPVAGQSRIELRSDWPHPSFRGQFLPQPQTQGIGKDGFTAHWTITALASSAQQQMQSLIDARKDGLAGIERLEVAFIEPIDIYALSDRAVKYGFLFVGLTFGCFFLFEVIKRLALHPIHYLLVGLALATFFLLLIALSEHVAFWIAYALAASACIALMGYYLSAVLAGVGRGLAFAAMLTALYSALYGLLVSADNALLLGSVLVFGLIAAAMALTRKVDWYRVGSGATQLTEAP